MNAKYQKIYEDFVGKGKVQCLDIAEDEGKFILHYKEGNSGKTQTVACEDYDTLNQICLEFGGRNPDTCRADGKFLRIGDKEHPWEPEDISALGHRVNKIEIEGLWQKKTGDDWPIRFPQNSGSRSIEGSKKEEIDEFTLIRSERKDCHFTRTFKSMQEFKNLIKFLTTSKSLEDLLWYVKMLCTENTTTQDQCVWKRVKAGDGTQRMVLELVELNGKSYTECMRRDLYNAADEMFFSPCQLITMKKKQETGKTVCLLAVEDGKVNVDGYEVAEPVKKKSK
jgi:hypothetical protein